MPPLAWLSPWENPLLVVDADQGAPQTQKFLHILKVRKQEGLMRAEGNRILGVEGRETTREITNIEEDISTSVLTLT